MRLRRFASFVNELTGRADADFVACLSGQITATLTGARLAREVARHRLPTAVARDRMTEIEHEGDQERARLIERLSHALMTPIDREDLFRLSRSIDDVLDNLRDFVRELDLMGVKDHALFVEVIDAVVEGVEQLGIAVNWIIDEPERVTQGALAAKKSENVVRQLYQAAVSRNFAEELSVEMLKRRELLRRLDVVGLRLGEAADALADGAMKRSH